jgi:Kef-type K+ transport system membrane component KefB
MRKVLLYSVLLLLGLLGSQILPGLLGDAFVSAGLMIRALTMAGLAFIMIHVGFEFHIDKSRLGKYGWDYVVAFTAATFPWIFVTGYFVFVLLPADFWSSGAAWKETLLAGRFAAPTSAGVLFSMLAAAGLGATWLFRKARILAIFDDLDTVLLMIPLKMLMVGLAWQLGMIVIVMAVMLALAYIYLHRITIPVTWPWVLGYAVAIAVVSELVYAGTKIIDPSVPIHIEVLLPAFALGCIARPPHMKYDHPDTADHRAHDVEHALHSVLDRPAEKSAATAISAVFMVLVGLSMPAMFGGGEAKATDPQHVQYEGHALDAAAPYSAVEQSRADAAAAAAEENGQKLGTVTASQPSLSWPMLIFHVLMITIISNIGKMFPAFCYRREAHWRHRLAVAIGMWPRGEVGAGVLVVSLSYGIGGPIVTVAMLSLALNLALTGVFILVVNRLIRDVPETPPGVAAPTAA